MLFLDYSESDEGFDFMRLITRGSDAQRLKALIEASFPFLDLEETQTGFLKVCIKNKAKLEFLCSNQRPNFSLFRWFIMVVVFISMLSDTEDKLADDYELQAWGLELVADGNPRCGIKVGNLHFPEIYRRLFIIVYCNSSLKKRKLLI